MRKGFKVGALLLLLLDLTYVFYQQYHGPIDGDLTATVLPSPEYSDVLHDPFGLKILLHNAHFAGAGSFVFFWTVSNYFKTTPFFFQLFASPIDSIYLSCALAKIVVLALFIYLLSVYISGQYKIFNKNFLLAAVLIIPLFQTGGYCWVMGVIDPSTVGFFGYSFAMLLVVAFFLPFFMSLFYERKLQFSYLTTVLLLLFALINIFLSILNGPLMILICSFMLMEQWRQAMVANKSIRLTERILISLKQLPRNSIYGLIFITVFSLYHFYIATNNLESANYQIPLWQRYTRLPYGILHTFGSKPFVMLLTMITINVIVIRKRTDLVAQKILRLLVWIGIFSFIIIVTLPLGGYRFYRPEIIRRDAIIPVTIALIGFYGLSTFYVLKNITIQHKRIYLYMVIIPLVHFALVNTYNMPDNSCEKSALMQLAASKEKIVLLDQDCTIMSWFKVTDYKESKTNAQMFKYWNITREEKYYYQK
jgi:hypothetical protein